MTTDYQPKDAAYEARVRDSFSRQPFMSYLGAELLRVAPGETDIALTPRPELTQQHGFVHAGAVAAVLDTACGYAAYSLMPAKASVLSVEFKINLLAPAVGESLVAQGRVLRPGRTLTACSGQVWAVQGEKRVLVAALQATIMTVFDRPDVREGERSDAG